MAELKREFGKAEVGTFVGKCLEGPLREAIVGKWRDAGARRRAIESKGKGLGHHSVANRVEAAGAKGMNDRVHSSINLLRLDGNPSLGARSGSQLQRESNLVLVNLGGSTEPWNRVDEAAAMAAATFVSTFVFIGAKAKSHHLVQSLEGCAYQT